MCPSEYTPSVPVSAVVLTYNSSDTIVRCLESIELNHPREIVVVDGGSADQTVELTKLYTNKVLLAKAKSRARMLGALHAGSEYVAYVDSDIVLPSGLFAAMLERLNDPDAAVVSCLGQFGPRTGLTYWARCENIQSRWSARVKHDSVLLTQCCVARRSLWLQYGFEENYGGGLDDRDLAIRLSKSGVGLILHPTLVTHLKNHTLRQFLRHRWHLGEVEHGYVRKYGLGALPNLPLAVAVFWSLYSIAQRHASLIPYHLVNGVAESLGMLLGRG